MNILIPTDFSDTARNAISFAIAAFGKDNRFILMNAYEEPSSTTSSMISLRDILHESSVDSLKDEEQYIRVELHNPDLNLTTKSIYGDAISSINSCLQQDDIDLVVMGTTGATGLKEVTIGSVASGVINNVKCPILAVPGDFKFTSLGKVLFASDLRTLTNNELPTFFLEWLKEHESKVTLLTVDKSGKMEDEEAGEQSDALNAQLEGIEHHFETIQANDIDDAILGYAAVSGTQMIVTVPRKSSWFNRLLKPSVSKKLAHHLEVPMLALSQD